VNEIDEVGTSVTGLARLAATTSALARKEFGHGVMDTTAITFFLGHTNCLKQLRIIMVAPFFTTAAWYLVAALVVPSWEELATKIPRSTPLVFHDKLPSDVNNDGNNKPILFRDKNGICPLCQQVWLALEVKGIDYITILVDDVDQQENTNNDWSSPLQVQWADGSVQTDVLEILEKMEQTFPAASTNINDKDTSRYAPNLYPSISKAVDSVRCNIVRFKGVFPRNTVPTKLAPYLIRQATSPEKDTTIWVPIDDHMVTLEETDEVLEEYYQGPFLCGAKLTAADIVWAPFLERYAAQLPRIYKGDICKPRSAEYETLRAWYKAMEEQIPCWSSRVSGDPTTWQRLLETAVTQQQTPPIDSLLPVPRGMANLIPFNRKTFPKHAMWEQYAKSRPHVAKTPELECVAYYVRNRDTILQQAATSKVLSNMMNPEEMDVALRELLEAIVQMGSSTTTVDPASIVSSLSGNARDLVSYLEERLSVPRDMGALPAAALRKLVAVAPKPRISVAATTN
jgi:glutathione S-transferase